MVLRTRTNVGDGQQGANRRPVWDGQGLTEGTYVPLSADRPRSVVREGDTVDIQGRSLSLLQRSHRGIRDGLASTFQRSTVVVRP